MDDYKTNISFEGKNGSKKEYKEVLWHGFVDSFKIQVTKGQAKGSIELLIEGSPTQIPRLAETCRSSRILCFIYLSFAFSDFHRAMFFKQSVLHTNISC